MVNTLQDVTERKRAEERLTRLNLQQASILNSAGDGIHGIDGEGRIIFANPAAAALSGYADEEVVGRRQHDLVHHSKPDGSPYPYGESPIVQALRDAMPHHAADDLFWRKDGSSFPVEYTATPIRENGEVRGAVVVFRDITERREIDRLKAEFTSVVSHELRTPLTSIRGSLGLLAGGVLGPLPGTGQRMLDIAVANTDRLVRLINDILDIERIESGQAPLQQREVGAADILGQAVELLDGVAREAGIALVARPIDAKLWADPDRLTQTLTNLISNAIKFSPPGTTVSVTARRSGAEILFTVADQGRGIPQGKLEMIFERFQQVDGSDAREKGGTGLGLAICRSIVEQHGGRMWA
ncbi:MAG: ATP-binding protein, partial [Chloroflexota bacterium]|nr:ATP-binding protein [Chloroflexota bacterium]